MANYSRNKTSGNIMPLLVFAVVALIVGSLAGYYYASQNKNSNIALNVGPKSVSQKMIDEPIQKWGALVNKAYAQFEVEGTVTEIKDGVGGPVERQGPGKLITLKNGTNTATYFVQASSDWWEGAKDKKPWKAIEEHEVKVGDMLAIQMHVPISNDTKAEDAFGYSVLKVTK